MKYNIPLAQYRNTLKATQKNGMVFGSWKISYFTLRTRRHKLKTIDYHLSELNIALDKANQNRVLPMVLDSDMAILDIGCGIGQSFIALNCVDRVCVGLDIDDEALRYGTQQFGDKIHFVIANANRLPLSADSFNLVFSRVSLPYTNIPEIICDIKRVLKQDGRVWMTLHNKAVALGYFKDAIASRNIKRVVHVLYILLNGYLLKYCGFLLPFFNGRFESWQDTSAMKKLLMRHGFAVEESKIGRHTVIEGRLSKP